MENKNKHILIVDDDNGIRDLLKDYLKKISLLYQRLKTLKMRKNSHF